MQAKSHSPEPTPLVTFTVTKIGPNPIKDGIDNAVVRRWALDTRHPCWRGRTPTGKAICIKMGLDTERPRGQNGQVTLKYVVIDGYPYIGFTLDIASHTCRMLPEPDAERHPDKRERHRAKHDRQRRFKKADREPSAKPQPATEPEDKAPDYRKAAMRFDRLAAHEEREYRNWVEGELSSAEAIVP